MAWADVENDPRYADLAPTEKTRLREHYFDTKVASNPKYAAMPDADKKKAKDAFLLNDQKTNISGQNIYPPAKQMTKGEAAVGTVKAMGSDTAEYLSKNALALIGGAEGAAEGAVIGAATTGPLAPAGAALGAVLGAYAGGVAGQSVTEAIEAGVNAIAPGLGPQKTPGEVLKSVRDQGNAMGEAEILGRGAGNVLGMAGKALLPRLEERAPQVVRAVRAAMSANILPSMSQITQSRFVAGAEEIGSKLPFGIGTRIMAMRSEQEAGYDALRREVLAKAGSELKPEVLGTQTADKVHEYLDMKIAERQKAVLAEREKILANHGETTEAAELGRQLDALRAAADASAKKTNTALYADIDQMIPPGQNQVPDTNGRAAAAKIVMELTPTPTAFPTSLKSVVTPLSEGPGGKVISETGAPVIYAPDGSVASKVIAERKTYTFKEMSNIVSDLTQRIKQESLKNNPFGKAVAGSTTPEGLRLMALKDGYLKDLESFSNGLPGDVKAAKTVADTNYRAYKGKFGNADISAMSRMAKDNPSQVYDLFVKGGVPERIQRLKSVVGEEGMVPFRRKFVDDMITGPDGKMLDGASILRKMNDTGWEALKEILTPEQLADLHASAVNMQTPQFVEGAIEKKLRLLITHNGGGRAPEEIVQRVVDGDSVTVKALRKIMGPKGMEPYKRAVLEDAIGKPAEAVGLSGAAPAPTTGKIGKTLKAYGRTIDYLFSPEEVADIGRVEQARDLMESQAALNANRAGTSSSLNSGLISGGVGTLILTNPVKGVTIAIGADLLSRFYVSKTGRQLLIDGMSDKAAGSIQLYSRLAAFILNAKKGEFNDEAAKLGPVAAPPKPLPQRVSPETRAQAYDTRIDAGPTAPPQTPEGRGLLGIP